jgi:uncharacterized protein (TIGR00730 family)
MTAKKKNNTKPAWLIKAYDNADFLHSPAGRTLRVLSELIEPASRFRKHKVHNTVVFFGSARAFPEKTARKNLLKLRKKIKRCRVIPKNLRGECRQAEKDLVMSRYHEDAVKLSSKLTLWFRELEKQGKHFMVCSGGGPGIMEAANLGAKKAGGKSVGLNISIPMEQMPNQHQTKELACEFHYFFIRKFWFFYLAKALVIFPGGFGTLDELFELLTLVQTGKTKKKMPIVLYDSKYWNNIINFDAMIEWGVISRKDLTLFKIFDDIDKAYEYLKGSIEKYYVGKT